MDLVSPSSSRPTTRYIAPLHQSAVRQRRRYPRMVELTRFRSDASVLLRSLHAEYQYGTVHTGACPSYLGGSMTNLHLD